MEHEQDGPATGVLVHIEETRTALREIRDPVSRVESARAVRANAKKYESLAAEISREAVQEMREDGKSYGTIADELGVTRARAQQLANNRKR